jgi:SAM-dependent methyltransferase
MPALSNADYIRAVEAVEAYHPKGGKMPEEVTRTTIDFFLDLHAALRCDLRPGAVVLDFGCAAGAATAELDRRGYDAFGVDILEYWGKDAALIGEEFDPPAAHIAARLAVVPASNRLPFGDDRFDAIISDQVLEHVFDLRPIFEEQVRVLKPGGIAMHRFPKSTCLIEAHTKLPFTPLHRFDLYLGFCALLGLRSPRQQDMNWRQAWQSYRDLFSTTHYLPRREILRLADLQGVTAYFHDSIAINPGRTGRLYRAAKQANLGWLAKPICSAIAGAQVLVMEKRSSL